MQTHHHTRRTRARLFFESRELARTANSRRAKRMHLEFFTKHPSRERTRFISGPSRSVEWSLLNGPRARSFRDLIGPAEGGRGSADSSGGVSGVVSAWSLFSRRALSFLITKRAYGCREKRRKKEKIKKKKERARRFSELD